MRQFIDMDNGQIIAEDDLRNDFEVYGKDFSSFDDFLLSLSWQCGGCLQEIETGIGE